MEVTLGIDPGTAILGYGVVGGADELTCVTFGALRTTNERPMADRLAVLHTGLVAIIATYRPTVLAVEQLLFGRNVSTALTVGQARGVALLAGAQAGLRVVEYKPAQVKEAVVGYGRASKAQVQEMVRLLLGLHTVPEPDDAADALAVAICHTQTARFLARVPLVEPGRG